MPCVRGAAIPNTFVQHFERKDMYHYVKTYGLDCKSGSHFLQCKLLQTLLKLIKNLHVHELKPRF